MCVDSHVLGIDGGATKTIALIGSMSKILGQGESGSSNYHNVGTVAAGKAIRSAVTKAKKQARLQGTRLDTAVVALAAIDSTAGVRIARRFVRLANVAKQTFVIHDSVAAVYAATQGSPGITVNAGTGCFAAGVNEAGEYARVGGWGYLIDDKGSAFDIGMKAISHGFRMVDGRTPLTQLKNLLKRRFGVRIFDEILDGIYSNEIGVEEIAALAPYVSEAASHDKVCRQILSEAGTALADLACTAARRLKMTNTSFPLSMVGGGFNAGPYLVIPFKSLVRGECPRVHFLRLKIEPARGAYLIAGKLACYGPRGLPRNDRWLRTVIN